MGEFVGVIHGVNGVVQLTSVGDVFAVGSIFFDSGETSNASRDRLGVVDVFNLENKEPILHNYCKFSILLKNDFCDVMYISS